MSLQGCVISIVGAFAVLALAVTMALASDGAVHTCLVPGGTEAPINSLDDLPEGQFRPLCTAHLVDTSGRVTPEEIVALPFLAEPSAGSFPIATPDGALWLRFALANPHDHNVDWVLGFMETILDDVILYREDASGLGIVAANGRTVPAAMKASRGAKTAIPITMEPGESAVFYLRISGTFAAKITPVLVTEPLFVRWSATFGYVSVVLLVFTGTMALFSFVIFRHIEARIHRYYALFMAASFSFTFLYDGWLSDIFGVTWSVATTVPLIELIAGLTLLANIQYCRILLGAGRAPARDGVAFMVLTGVVMVSTVFATANPWVFAPIHHLIFFLSPMVLLVLAVPRLRDGMVQVPPICASLACLILGLAVSNYFFLFPVAVSETSSLQDLMAMRPIVFSYAFAIIGEGAFMTLAISRMLNAAQAQKRHAVATASALQRDLLAAEAQNAQAMQRTADRIKALESALAKAPGNTPASSAEQRLVDRATECVLAHIAKTSFGPGELAAELAVSEKTLGRRLKGALDVTPAAFIRKVRLSFARDLVLLRQYETVAEVAYAAGFASVSHFSKLYREEFGETPKATLKPAKPRGEAGAEPGAAEPR